MDCGKEFLIDYSDVGLKLDECTTKEEFLQKLIDYQKSHGCSFPINICSNCLKPLVNMKNPNANTKIEEQKNMDENCKKYINKLKEKFAQEEEELKKYSNEEEEKKKKELEDMKKTVEKNESHLKELLKELEVTEQKENIFCDDFRKLEMDIYDVEKELSKSNDIKLDYENKIKSFSNTNIFTELFQISFNGKYGIINGCSFCEPTSSTNWDSINGGWGYIMLLTKLLSIKYKFESIKYELVPIGNYSKIIDKDKKIEYELILNDIKLRDKFNVAMMAYLEYLAEFMNYLFKEGKIKVNNGDICPKITGDKINNKSIKIESGKEKIEDWHQCMKFLLTILKFLILQVLISENEAFQENIENIDIINNINEIKKTNDNKV
jgi:hypothetical protein